MLRHRGKVSSVVRRSANGSAAPRADGRTRELEQLDEKIQTLKLLPTTPSESPEGYRSRANGGNALR